MCQEFVTVGIFNFDPATFEFNEARQVTVSTLLAQFAKLWFSIANMNISEVCIQANAYLTFVVTNQVSKSKDSTTT